MRGRIVLYPDGDDSEGIYRLNADGTEWGPGLGQQSKFDLINIPEKIEGWVNIYAVSHTKDEADKVAEDIEGRRACIKVSFTEGEGLTDDNNRP